MNWIKENRFLAGFFAVVVVGVGVLGYLLYSASSQYDDVSADYDRQATELSRLKHLRPYPNAENLEKLSDQKKEHQTKVDELQKSLAAMKLPTVPLTPEQFQDKLQAAVKDYTQTVTATGMKLPEKGFYLGFGRYQSEPPTPEAAPLLGAELDAMRIILDDLPKNSVVELKKLDREELPEEKPASAKLERNAQPAGRGKPSMIARTFDMTIVTPKGAFQAILNDMIANQRQFFIPRSVRAVDTEDKGPSKITDINNPAAAAAAVAAAAPATPPAPGALAVPGTPAQSTTTIVGDGLVEVSMRIEIVDFPNPVGKPSVATK